MLEVPPTESGTSSAPAPSRRIPHPGSDAIWILRHRVLLESDGTVRAMLGAEIGVGSEVTSSHFPGVTEEQWQAGTWLSASEL